MYRHIFGIIWIAMLLTLSITTLIIIHESPIVEASAGALPLTKAVRSINASPSITGYSGKGIAIAILDHGVDPNWIKYDKAREYIERLENVKPKRLIYYNAIDDTNEVVADDNHGTLIALIIVANTTDHNISHIGPAPGATIISIEVLRKDKPLTEQVLERAVRWVLMNRDRYNIRIVVCSWGLNIERFIPDGVVLYDKVNRVYKYDWVSKQLSRLLWHGIIVVASVGDDAYEQVLPSPSTMLGAIAVGATDPRGTISPYDDIVTYYSNYGPTHQWVLAKRMKPDIVAPGEISIPSCCKDVKNPLICEGVSEVSGTSYASALVAGAIAQMLEAKPDLTPAQVMALLRQTAFRSSNLGSYFPNPEAGWGIPNIGKAIYYAKKGWIDKNLMVDHYCRYSYDVHRYYDYPYIVVDTSAVTSYGPDFWQGKAIYISELFGPDYQMLLSLYYLPSRYSNWKKILYGLNIPYARIDSSSVRLWTPDTVVKHLVAVTASVINNRTDAYLFRAILKVGDTLLWPDIMLYKDMMNIRIIPVENYTAKHYTFKVYIDPDFYGAPNDYVKVDGSTFYSEGAISDFDMYVASFDVDVFDLYRSGQLMMDIDLYDDKSISVFHYMELYVLRYEPSLWRTTTPDDYVDAESVYGEDIALYIEAIVSSYSGPLRGILSIDINLRLVS